MDKIQVKLSRRWGSDRGREHRVDLRRYIGSNDLSRIPVLSEGFISISHTTDIGGFAIGPRPLGFDIEPLGRVRVEVAARVSRPHEAAEAPSPGHLWCAKEAAYKALYHYSQPRTLSDLEIQWLDVNRFSLSNAAAFGVRRGMGRIFIRHGHLLAIYEVR